MRKKLLILLAALALAILPPGTVPAEESPEPPESGSGLVLLTEIPEGDPAPGYVLVRMPEPAGLLPLPTEGEYTAAVRQTLPDGSEAYNRVRLTPEGFRIADADCAGHDCMQQGTVTLENRADRLLLNMIICLPHQLILELYTPEEARNLRFP